MRILAIEDNEPLALALKHRFEDQGHAVTIVHDGEAGRHFITQESFDLCILDINLPHLSGLDILTEVRRLGRQLPILILTARDNLADRVVGLDAGADDYLVKPFEMEELDARVRALLRRKGKPAEDEIRFGGLTINPALRFAAHDGVDLELARKEFAALECLVERDGRLIPKSQLIDHVYGIGTAINETTIEVLISRLRKKLAPCGVEIKMARGLGYHLKVAD